jgi:hypothetical protein
MEVPCRESEGTANAWMDLTTFIISGENEENMSEGAGGQCMRQIYS